MKLIKTFTSGFVMTQKISYDILLVEKYRTISLPVLMYYKTDTLTPVHELVHTV